MNYIGDAFSVHCYDKLCSGDRADLQQDKTV